jgi:hypothetical protein
MSKLGKFASGLQGLGLLLFLSAMLSSCDTLEKINPFNFDL